MTTLIIVLSLLVGSVIGALGVIVGGSFWASNMVKAVDEWETWELEELSAQRGMQF